VRFGQDVAGIPELGTTGRGENMEIGTWIERSVDHELSGNIIDLCPVGALNSKPFRFQGRSWEMTQAPLVAPHDGFGSNLFGHVLRGKLKRVVPRPNESINETWIADRDRFSYEGLHAEDRLLKPMLRVDGQWREASWEEALQAAARGLKAAGENLGTLVHPSCTTEEAHLAARVTRSLGSANVDHRLRVRDFRDAAADPLRPTLGLPIAEVDSLTGVLVIGGNLRAELPLLAHRLRKAAVRGKARIAFVEAEAATYHFPVAARVGATPAAWVHELAALIKAAAELLGTTPGPLFADLLHGVVVNDAHRAAAAALCHGTQRVVWLGAMALRHPASVDLRALAAELARLADARLGVLAEGGNAAGLWLAGCVPHRDAGGRAATTVGHSTQAMLEHSQRAYLLVGAMEPEADFADATLAERAFAQAACVVALTPFASESIKRVAHVLLPMAAFAETSGTYVNLEGAMQSQAAATAAPGEARPGWKILRVLANVLELEGFAQQSSEDVRAELQQLIEAASGARAPESLVSTHVPAIAAVSGSADLDLGGLDVPMYSIDAVLRRSPALQQTSIAARSRAAGGQG